jgi:hypothetical protein
MPPPVGRELGLLRRRTQRFVSTAEPLLEATRLFVGMVVVVVVVGDLAPTFRFNSSMAMVAGVAETSASVKRKLGFGAVRSAFDP